MSRVPQPQTGFLGYEARPFRPEPTPADYSDDVSDEDFAALRALVRDEVENEEYELSDGPAW